MKILGIVLLAAGILALAYGGFSYTRETHEAKVARSSFGAEKKRVNVPCGQGGPGRGGRGPCSCRPGKKARPLAQRSSWRRAGSSDPRGRTAARAQLAHSSTTQFATFSPAPAPAREVVREQALVGHDQLAADLPRSGQEVAGLAALEEMAAHDLGASFWQRNARGGRRR